MIQPNNKPHIVIVGAGIIGASIAFNLARRGVRVTVLEAGEPGQGASAVSFAWINARDKNPRHYHDLNRRSLDMWDRFARRLGGEVGLTWGGELRWAATAEEAKRLIGQIKELQSWGYPIRLIDAAELKQMEPGLAPGMVVAASYTDFEGHVDTGQVVRACLAKASAWGATVYSQSKVTGFQLEHSSKIVRVKVVSVGERHIPCDAVVLAGGPDTAALAAYAGLKLPLYHTFGATMMTEPVAPIFQAVSVIHTPRDLEPQVNVRQLPDGSVMIHGGSHGGPHDGSLGRTEEELDWVLAAAVDFLPGLSGVKIREVRRGRRPIPQDGQPIIGFPVSWPNLYVAVMHSGVSLAPLIGEFAAIEIVDGSWIDLLEPYRVERFV